MANHKSALKRNRQNHKRNERNKGSRTLGKTVSKKVRNEAEAGNKEQAQKELKIAREPIASLVTNILGRGILIRSKEREAEYITLNTVARKLLYLYSAVRWSNS